MNYILVAGEENDDIDYIFYETYCSPEWYRIENDWSAEMIYHNTPPYMEDDDVAHLITDEEAKRILGFDNLYRRPMTGLEYMTELTNKLLRKYKGEELAKALEDNIDEYIHASKNNNEKIDSFWNSIDYIGKEEYVEPFIQRLKMNRY